MTPDVARETSDAVTPERVGQLEAILFASDAPLPIERIAEVLEIAPLGRPRPSSKRCARRATATARGLAVVEVGGGVRLVTRPEHAPVLMSLQRLRLKSRLSRAAVETLTIVAYRQPISRPEIEQLRGVGTESVLAHLLERRLIRVVGRKATPGPARALRDDARVPRALRAPRPRGSPAVRAAGGRARGGVPGERVGGERRGAVGSRVTATRPRGRPPDPEGVGEERGLSSPA